MVEPMVTQPGDLAAARPTAPGQGAAHDLLPFVQALSMKMIEELRLDSDDFLVDLCCGKSCFSTGILEQVQLRHQILAVDPSQTTPACLPICAEIRSIAMDALSFSEYPIRCDKILLKDGIAAIDVRVRARLFAGLRDRLREDGILLLVNTVPHRGLPLFDKALQRLEAEHVGPDELSAQLHRAGFQVHRSRFEYEHRIALDRYCRLVEQRFVPVLAGFDDREIRNGISEIRRNQAGRSLVEYTDRFDLLAATRPVRGVHVA
jgi:hypothetical protein